jgi:hypothetical protein
MGVVFDVCLRRCVILPTTGCIDEGLLRIVVAMSYARWLLRLAIHAHNAPRRLERKHNQHKEKKQSFHRVRDCTNYRLDPQTSRADPAKAKPKIELGSKKSCDYAEPASL